MTTLPRMTLIFTHKKEKLLVDQQNDTDESSEAASVSISFFSTEIFMSYPR